MLSTSHCTQFQNILPDFTWHPYRTCSNGLFERLCFVAQIFGRPVFFVRVSSERRALTTFWWWYIALHWNFGGCQYSCAQLPSASRVCNLRRCTLPPNYDDLLVQRLDISCVESRRGSWYKQIRCVFTRVRYMFALRSWLETITLGTDIHTLWRRTTSLLWFGPSQLTSRAGSTHRSQLPACLKVC